MKYTLLLLFFLTFAGCLDHGFGIDNSSDTVDYPDYRIHIEMDGYIDEYRAFVRDSLGEIPAYTSGTRNLPDSLIALRDNNDSASKTKLLNYRDTVTTRVNPIYDTVHIEWYSIIDSVQVTVTSKSVKIEDDITVLIDNRYFQSSN